MVLVTAWDGPDTARYSLDRVKVYPRNGKPRVFAGTEAFRSLARLCTFSVCLGLSGAPTLRWPGVPRTWAESESSVESSADAGALRSGRQLGHIQPIVAIGPTS